MTTKKDNPTPRAASRKQIKGPQPITPETIREGVDDWTLKLSFQLNGTPRADLRNAVIALENAPEWRGVLARDEFAWRTVAKSLPPIPRRNGAGEEWTSDDDVETAIWLQSQDICVGVDTAAQAVESVAAKSSFHPVRDYLRGLVWDGIPRLGRMLTDHFGAADSPLIQEVSLRFMISAVARVEIPGCQADHALILEGGQGIGKSTNLRVLFSAPPGKGEWFTDALADIGTKDADLALRGVWAVELAELDALNRKEANQIKAFLSRRVDRFRPPYGKRLGHFPRQLVFAGTTNGSTYLKDATGGRRFWPVACKTTPGGRLDPDALAKAKDQLWAETYALFKGGEKWHITDPIFLDEIREEQEARREIDMWETDVLEYISGLGWVTLPMIADALAIPKDRQGGLDQRLGKILKAHGWEKQKRRREQGRLIHPWERVFQGVPKL